MEGATPWWMAGSAAAGVLLLKAWDWWQQRRSLRAAEGGASALIEGLTARVQELQSRVSAIEERLVQEIKARVAAQEEAAMLRVRVRVLEHALRSAGIALPPPLDEAPAMKPAVATGD